MPINVTNSEQVAGNAHANQSELSLITLLSAL